MAKGGIRSETAQLYKSLASTTLEPNKTARAKAERGVNDRIEESRREQRKRERALQPNTSAEVSFPPPPPVSSDEVEGSTSTRPALSAPGRQPTPSSSVSRAAPPTPYRRAPSGPPPPKSWITTSATQRSSESAIPSTHTSPSAQRLLAHPLFPSLIPTFLEPPEAGASRLLVLCLRALLPLLATHDLSSLPQHLRVGLVSIAGQTQGGLTDGAARDLLWDLRDWNPGGPVDDDWEEEKEGDDSVRRWTTLDLTSTALPLSTIKQLLLSLPTIPPTLTPVTSLSLAYAASHLSVSILLAALPNHLRTLSLAGTRLYPSGSSSSSFPTTSILVRLSLATPLLNALDLSYTTPPIRASEIARLPWTGAKECWTLLKVLGLRGLASDDSNQEDRQDVDGAEPDALSLRTVRGAMRGRRAGWVEVFVA